MKIAMVAPLYESVPPRLYGGTERVVSYLTEALVDQGHDVTLFASGDSQTRARLVATTPKALRLDTHCKDSLAHHMVHLDEVFERAAEFDLIHFHCDYLHYPFTRRLDIPSLTTLHGRLDLPDHTMLYRHFDDVPLVSVSNAQRRPLPWARWVSTVYHGLPSPLSEASFEAGDYVMFLGRVSPEKRVDRAIQIARRAGVTLKIVAKVDAADREYHESVIRPLLGHPEIEFLGERGEREKLDLLRGARALLFPIEWPEPFGLAMIEAMSCGTPVIAWRRGSVEEVVDNGVTGFVVDSIDGAVEAVHRARALDRRAVRRRFDHRFSADRMARDYHMLYRQVAEEAWLRTRSGATA